MVIYEKITYEFTIFVLYKSTKYCIKKNMHFFSMKEVYKKKRQEDKNDVFF